MQKEKRRTYAVDLDGVLCTEVKHWQGEVPKPIMSNVEKVNALYDQGNVIFIYTSRLEIDRLKAEIILSSMGVKYHALVMGKLQADVYIDDKNGNL